MRDRHHETLVAGRGVGLLGAALLGALLLLAGPAGAAGIGPVEGGALPAPLPLLPPDNWWNLDIKCSRPVSPPRRPYLT